MKAGRAAGREGAWLEASGELYSSVPDGALGWLLPAGHVFTSLTSLSHFYLILCPRGSHGNGARRFGGKARMTAWMEQ